MIAWPRNAAIVKEMEREEYERLKAQAKANYLRDLAALEHVWKLSRASKVPAVAQHPTPAVIPPSGATIPTELKPHPAEALPAVSPITTKRKRGSLDKAVKEVVSAIDIGTFSIREVEPRVKEADPDANRSSISSALKRMTETGELIVVEEGAGRRPTKYQKAA